MDALAPITRTSRRAYSTKWKADIQPVRDINYLKLFNTYTYLPTPWIHELVCSEVQVRITRDRLRLLTAHPNRLFNKPERQFDGVYNPNNRDLIYSRSAEGEKLLRSRGITVYSKPTNEIAHRLMIDVGMASIELGRQKTDIKQLSAYDILSLAPIATQKLTRPFRVPVAFSYKDQFHRFEVEPDRIFELEHPGGLRRFFFVEFDRDTESLAHRGHKISKEQKTILRSILEYKEIAKQRIYASHFGTGGMNVLFVVPSETRRRAILDLIKRELGDTKLFGVAVMADLERFMQPPKPTTHLFTTPWERVGFPPLDLANPKS